MTPKRTLKLGVFNQVFDQEVDCLFKLCGQNSIAVHTHRLPVSTLDAPHACQMSAFGTFLWLNWELLTFDALQHFRDSIGPRAELQ